MHRLSCFAVGVWLLRLCAGIEGRHICLNLPGYAVLYGGKGAGKTLFAKLLWGLYSLTLDARTLTELIRDTIADVESVNSKEQLMSVLEGVWAKLRRSLGEIVGPALEGLAAALNIDGFESVFESNSCKLALKVSSKAANASLDCSGNPFEFIQIESISVGEAAIEAVITAKGLGQWKFGLPRVVVPGKEEDLLERLVHFGFTLPLLASLKAYTIPAQAYFFPEDRAALPLVAKAFFAASLYTSQPTTLDPGLWGLALAFSTTGDRETWWLGKGYEHARKLLDIDVVVDSQKESHVVVGGKLLPLALAPEHVRVVAPLMLMARYWSPVNAIIVDSLDAYPDHKVVEAQASILGEASRLQVEQGWPQAIIVTLRDKRWVSVASGHSAVPLSLVEL